MKHLQQQTPTLDSLSNKIAHRLKGKKLDAEVLEKVGNTKIPGYRNRRCPQGSPVGDSSAPFTVPTLFHSTQVLYLQEREPDRSRTDHTPILVNGGGHRYYRCGIKPKIKIQGFPLAVQWLRLHSSNAGVTDLIPGQGTKIPPATQCSQKKEFKINTQYYICLDIWGKLEGFHWSNHNSPPFLLLQIGSPSQMTFHAKMGTIKLDRNGMDLTEAEDTKKRWQEYTEELYKKDLHDPDNHDGVITHLEPDILECKVKWALRKHHCEQSLWRW